MQNEIKISLQQQKDIIQKIRDLLDAEFDSINITKNHGKIFRAEEESEVLAKVYQGLLKKMEIPNHSIHQYVMILRGHLEKIDNK